MYAGPLEMEKLNWGIDVTSSAKRDEVTNSNILIVGQITMRVPSPEPRAEEVNPNFRTPS